MIGKNKNLVLLNTITLALMLFVNYTSATAVFSTVTVRDVSHKYDTLFAPAGYAFIIWSPIFLLCIGFVAYQWILLNSGDPTQYINRTGIWFAISNIANSLWLYCWINELIGWYVMLIILLMMSIWVLEERLGLEL